jgi:hypothetical protein
MPDSYLFYPPPSYNFASILDRIPGLLLSLSKHPFSLDPWPRDRGSEWFILLTIGLAKFLAHTYSVFDSITQKFMKCLHLSVICPDLMV